MVKYGYIMKWASQSRRAGRGFTIVELLIVIVVIGVLAAITVAAYTGMQERSKTNRANAELSSLKKAMLSYKALNSELPPVGDSWNFDTDPPNCGPLNTLEAALQTAGVANSIPKRDPWGNCWGYDDNDCNTTSPLGAPTNVRSVGPDGANNTADDIILNVNVKGAC
jgi:type II secretion system protein G